MLQAFIPVNKVVCIFLVVLQHSQHTTVDLQQLIFTAIYTRSLMWPYKPGSTAILRIFLMSIKILLHALFLLGILVFLFQFILKIYEMSSGTPTRRNSPYLEAVFYKQKSSSQG